ncbi:MAG: VOC family protein [Pseudomonadota bacterium]
MEKQPIVAWTEINVTDLNAACAYYADVFEWKMEIIQMGPQNVAIFNGADEAAGGHLQEGTPAQGGGTVVHLTVPGTLEEAGARVAKAGGQIVSPAIDIPDGRFQYMVDPDGNTVGMFELKAAA